jgi:hypothetical protein
MTPAFRIVCIAMACVALAACAAREEVKLPPPPMPGEPPGLIGLTAPKLRYVFGRPAFVRKDGEDEMWRYDGASCRAFFFLYPDDGRLEVRHVETLPHGKERATDPTCLDALRGRAAPPVS